MTEKPPTIVEIDGPDQVELGTEVDLHWTLAGGQETQLHVNGVAASGASYKGRVTQDPTGFTLTISNSAGTASKTKWVHAHEPGKVVSGHATVSPPGGAALAPEVIPVGSRTAPPKKSDYVANMAAEKAWFARLQEIQIADLVPGDLLFYKFFDDANLIVKGQSIFTGAEKGSKYSIHCQVYMGAGKVLSAEAQGVITNDVWPDMIVYRATDKARAASAADVARFLVGQKIIYSTFHIFEEPIHDRSYGPSSKGRAEKIHRRESPSVSMMCSESVTYCFQDDFNDPWIPLDPPRVGPIHVEDYVNSHPERFTFAGKILKATGGASSSASEYAQAYGAIKAEAKADVHVAVKKVEKVAAKAAQKLKHFF